MADEFQQMGAYSCAIFIKGAKSISENAISFIFLQFLQVILLYIILAFNEPVFML